MIIDGEDHDELMVAVNCRWWFDDGGGNELMMWIDADDNDDELMMMTNWLWWWLMVMIKVKSIPCLGESVAHNSLK